MNITIKTLFSSTAFLALFGLGQSVLAAQENIDGSLVIENHTNGVYLRLGAEQLTLTNDTLASLNNVRESSVGIGYQFNNQWASEIIYLTSQIDDSSNFQANIDYLSLQTIYRFSARPESSWHARVGLGQYQFSQNKSFETNEAAISLGAGYDFHLNSNLFISLQTQAIYPQHRQELDWQSSLSLNYFFMDSTLKVSQTSQKTLAETTLEDIPKDFIRDADHDGIVDEFDECPQTAMHIMVDNKGCGIYVINRESITLKVNFENNSAQVKPEFLQEIESLARFMQQHESLNLTIEGHTDNIGSPLYNNKLSKIRADAVASILVNRFNIATDRVRTEGFGESQPIANNLDTVGRALNRRVQAVLAIEFKQLKSKPTTNH